MPRTRRMPIHALLMCALAAALLAGAALAQPAHVLLVLDASGSMYLRLDDGQYRIAAAKDALTQFVTRLPDDPDLNVGLRVYGANLIAVEDGACLDSELVVPVEGFPRAELVRTLQAVDARGATPIAYSLELALEDLRGLEGRKVVVLVTDGAESCGGDVRAAVEALTDGGLDVDVRIIGFALSDLAIASFEGLGTFESTHSASELASALGRAVGIEVGAAHPVTVTLTRDGEPVADGATVRFVDAISGDATSLALDLDGVFAADLPAGNYRAEVADAFSPAPLVVGGLPVTPEGDNAFSFELAPAAEVALTVEPTDPRAGSVVSVRFEGAPATAGNWVTVVPRDVDDTVAVARAHVDGASGTVDLQIPGEATELEARFHLALPEGGTRVIGRSPAFASTPLAATLSAPAEVAAGTVFEVVWDGPADDGEVVAVVAVGAREGTYVVPGAISTRDGSLVRLRGLVRARPGQADADRRADRGSLSPAGRFAPQLAAATRGVCCGPEPSRSHGHGPGAAASATAIGPTCTASAGPVGVRPDHRIGCRSRMRSRTTLASPISSPCTRPTRSGVPSPKRVVTWSAIAATARFQVRARAAVM